MRGQVVQSPMRHLTKIFCLAAALVVMACSKQASDKASLQGRPLPNAEEVLEAAKVALNKFDGAALLVYPVGTPKNCVEGQMSGQHVLSCEVCATFMLAQPLARRSEDVYVEKLTLFIPFKRAVSLQQPDVAPLDQSSGVWQLYT